MYKIKKNILKRQNHIDPVLNSCLNNNSYPNHNGHGLPELRHKDVPANNFERVVCE